MKTKLSKQLEQEQNHRNGDHMEGYQQGEEVGTMGEKVQGISSIRQVQNRQREVKISIGNGEAKELIRMTRGHELRGENAGGNGVTGRRGKKGRKSWDYCNSVITKIYFT